MNANNTETIQPPRIPTDPRLPRLSEIKAFNDYMATGWGTPDRTPQVVQGAASAAAAHRGRLSEVLAGKTIVVGSGVAPVRNDDCDFLFRPDSNFYWLTGADIEDAILVLTPKAGGHDAVLYTPQPAYPGDPGFFADASHGELWVGAAPGAKEWSEALGIPVRDLESLQLPAGADQLVAGQFSGRQTERHQLGSSQELSRILSELRMIKDDWELIQLRSAVNHTVAGFAEVIREIPRAVNGLGERWLQGTFDRHARTHGNGVGYSTIVGSGKHAPTLHWTRCDGPVLADELLLLDMGVEENSFYTADVTRTFPPSGRFNETQRQVHDLVEKAHRAGLAQVRPGNRFTDFHHAAMEVIAQGLFDWGILPVSVDEALSPEGQHHRRFLTCGIGHHLGLDVHDCSRSSREAYSGAELAPGMVMAVEPGLYFHAHDLVLPPELRGMGVRLEDNVLVTATGSEVLSEALPIDASGIEAWMAEVQA
ncbi:aminopeptidase P family protein [Psychromicrobium lacuslunae]|uniref:Xaa-Pro aminopeptidase n=1 Tax=Psychromicrobium lacuslunae TaxID=1618207 RepID=A0A0D4C160_9MICC|nr:aminopeptidase P family protein [Psychromicrobium lacuslunae]AJT42294.1 Xaa-Pro aminopeptidase [Psychromicrobium lacuslunae]